MTDAHEAHRIPKPRPKAATILVIDDDLDSLRIISAALQWAGFKVVLARNGGEGIDYARAQIPSLILTDLAMPSVSGVEVIERLRNDPKTTHIPILAVTAHMGEAIADAATRAGCVGYVRKPFAAKDLVEKLQQYLSGVATTADTTEATGTIPWSRVEEVTRRR